MHPQHAGAGTARRHDIVIGLKEIDHLAGNGQRRLPVTGVVGRLAATGLGRWRLDEAACILQQLDGGQADGGAEEIDEAGDEESDADRQNGNVPGSGMQMSRAGWRATAGNASPSGQLEVGRPITQPFGA